MGLSWSILVNFLFTIRSSIGSRGELLSNERSKSLVLGGVHSLEAIRVALWGRFWSTRIGIVGNKPIPRYLVRTFFLVIAFSRT